MKKVYGDVRIPADPADFETTESRSALPPIEFSVAKGATFNTFTITDRQYPAQRAPTVAYRIYFLPLEFSPAGLTTNLMRMAGHNVASLVSETQAPGRGTNLTVTDTQFFEIPGYFYCVGVSRRGLEALPEHVVKAPA